MVKNIYKIGLLALGTIVYASCNMFAPTMSNYDQYAYAQTTSLKVDVTNIMDSATDNYQSHIKTINAVETNLQKLYTYEKNRPKNDITVKQWQILMDTTGHLFGGFMVRWRNEKKLGKAFIDDESKLVGQAFDQIAELESKKIKTPTN